MAVGKPKLLPVFEGESWPLPDDPSLLCCEWLPAVCCDVGEDEVDVGFNRPPRRPPKPLSLSLELVLVESPELWEAEGDEFELEDEGVLSWPSSEDVDEAEVGMLEDVELCEGT